MSRKFLCYAQFYRPFQFFFCCCAVRLETRQLGQQVLDGCGILPLPDKTMHALNESYLVNLLCFLVDIIITVHDFGLKLFLGACGLSLCISETLFKGCELSWS